MKVLLLLSSCFAIATPFSPPSADATAHAASIARLKAARASAAQRRTMSIVELTLRNDVVVAELGTRRRVLHRNPDVFVVDDVLSAAEAEAVIADHARRAAQTPLDGLDVVYCSGDLDVLREAFGDRDHSTTRVSEVIASDARPMRVGTLASCVNSSMPRREAWVAGSTDSAMPLTRTTVWRAGESSAVEALRGALEREVGLPRAHALDALVAQSPVVVTTSHGTDEELARAFARSHAHAPCDARACALASRTFLRASSRTTLEFPALGLSVPSRVGRVVLWESSPSVALDVAMRPIELAFTRHVAAGVEAAASGDTHDDALVLHQRWASAAIVAAPPGRAVVVCDAMEGCNSFVGARASRRAFERVAQFKGTSRKKRARAAAAALTEDPHAAEARYALSKTSHRAGKTAMRKLTALGTSPPPKDRARWVKRRKRLSTAAQQRLFESLCQLRSWVRAQPPSSRAARAFIGEVLDLASVVARETAKESGIRAYLLSAEIALVQARGLFDSGDYEAALMALEPVAGIAKRDGPAKKARRIKDQEERMREGGEAVDLMDDLERAQLDAQLFSSEEDIIDLEARAVRMCVLHGCSNAGEKKKTIVEDL